MGATPLVSVLVNNHDYARFVGRAIDSALAQTWPAVEVVVVDDGSTDDSREVIGSFGDRITAVFSENRGQRVAIETAFARSGGDIVMLLDADDVLYPDAAARVVAACRPGVSKVQFRLEAIDAADAPLHWTTPPLGREMPDGDVLPTLLRTGRYVTPPTSGNAFPRAVLEQLLPIPPEFPNSSDGYLVSAAPFLGPVASVPDVLGGYRVHGQNLWAPDVVDARRLAGYARHDVDKHRVIRDLATRRGLPDPGDLARRDHFHLRARLLSKRLDPAAHPWPEDRRLGLAWRGIVATARHSDLDLARRIRWSLWFPLTALGPAGFARRSAQWLYVPQSRPTGLRSSLRPRSISASSGGGDSASSVT